jgi:hypothetical protein
MIIIQTVSPIHVHQMWNIVGPFIKSAIDVALGSADCTEDQLKMQLINGSQTLLVAVEDEKVIGAATIQVSSFPNHRVATMTTVGGRCVVDEETFNQVVAWAKAQGATKIRAYASEARVRLYRQKVGLIATETVVEKLI